MIYEFGKPTSSSRLVSLSRQSVMVVTTQQPEKMVVRARQSKSVWDMSFVCVTLRSLRSLARLYQKYQDFLGIDAHVISNLGNAEKLKHSYAVDSFRTCSSDTIIPI